MHSSILPFSTPRVLSFKRIGPHNYDILCIIIGTLLGDATMDKKPGGYSVVFYQKGEHLDYMLWLHKKFFEYGYCSPNLPQIKSRIISKKDRKLVYYCRFRSFNFSSFEWIYEGFYGKEGKPKNIPGWVEEYLSPIALAIWIMDDGIWVKNRGLRLSTNCFSLKDVKFLVNVLDKKYGLKASIHKAGMDQYGIYLSKSNLPILYKVVLPHMHPFFYYKLDLNPLNLKTIE